MKNTGMTSALVLIGAGLFANAFMVNTPTVQAVPASAAVGVVGAETAPTATQNARSKVSRPP